MLLIHKTTSMNPQSVARDKVPMGPDAARAGRRGVSAGLGVMLAGPGGGGGVDRRSWNLQKWTYKLIQPNL